MGGKQTDLSKVLLAVEVAAAAAALNVSPAIYGRFAHQADRDGTTGFSSGGDGPVSSD